MGWKDVPDSRQSEKLPGGVHEKLRFKRVLRGAKDKPPFQSRDGSPQIMAILCDEQDREAPIMLTLSEKAAWKLKSILQAVGADLDAMDKDGVDWRHFADELFAMKQLCDRPFRGEVEWRPGEGGKEYADVKPYRRNPGAAAPMPDEIPI